ncbi:hypothetical protein R6Q57_018829 [Mikania cordata]
MGKTIRWFKALFGAKTESNSGHRKLNIPSCIRRNHTPDSTPFVNNTFEAQSRRAIAVAAVTAAAADAAVAAAQAAVAFVRITNQSRVTTTTTGAGNRENSAAIKIQSLFRGYLSRKALKALKSLVKIQALVRGYLVRKEAVRTLQGMEALFRARSSVSAQRFRLHHKDVSDESIRSRRISSFQIPNDGRPNPVELDLLEPKSRLTRANTWVWAADQTPSPLSTNSHHLSISASSKLLEFEPPFSTSHNTPRYAHSCGTENYGTILLQAILATWLANTKSFRAKVRSRSAPKQRPEYGLGLKKSDGFADVECGIRMGKSKSPLRIKNSFKNYVMDWKVLKRGNSSI